MRSGFGDEAADANPSPLMGKWDLTGYPFRLPILQRLPSGIVSYKAMHIGRPASPIPCVCPAQRSVRDL